VEALQKLESKIDNFNDCESDCKTPLTDQLLLISRQYFGKPPGKIYAGIVLFARGLPIPLIIQ
jgi:hypothetical protein